MSLQVISWNIAAVNNNPFEYWITHSDAGYTQLMAGIEEFVDEPGSLDVPVSDIFTEVMFEDLKQAMLAEGWTGVPETEKQWNENYKSRTIISGFLKDKDIGATVSGATTFAQKQDEATHTLQQLPAKNGAVLLVLTLYITTERLNLDMPNP